MRNAEPANNRRRRNRIWRGDNCSESESSRPWKRWHNGMRDPRNCEHCGQHQPDGEQEYWAKISPEITPRCEQRRRINQRRKNKVEHNVRIQARGTKLKASPPRTSTIGYGSAILCASTARTPTAVNKSTIISAWCMFRSWGDGVVESWSNGLSLLQYSRTPLRHHCLLRPR